MFVFSAAGGNFEPVKEEDDEYDTMIKEKKKNEQQQQQQQHQHQQQQIQKQNSSKGSN